jgi:hypothetical protein
LQPLSCKDAVCKILREWSEDWMPSVRDIHDRTPRGSYRLGKILEVLYRLEADGIIELTHGRCARIRVKEIIHADDLR